MKIAFLFFILLQIKTAASATLTIAVVPSGPSIYPDLRKAIGHAMVIIDCEDTKRFTSISMNLHGPYMQSESEISLFVKRYRSSVKFYSFGIDEKNCEKVRAFDDFYRDFPGVKFSLSIDPLIEYQKFMKGVPSHPGGTGASYAVAMLKIIGAKIPLESCKENFLRYRFETARSLMRCLTRSSGEQIP